jgi:tRNA uridine 5-carbamoylmethylation protein Kti12
MLVVFVGIPGSSKSTTVKELAKLFSIKHFFAEPGEEKWTDATKD